MEPINCYTCGAVILTYELGQSVPSYVVVAPGAPVPGGNHVVHICPQQPTYELQRRPSAVLDWTDEQERAAVRKAFPQWKLRDSDVIFCMFWYDPGWRLGAAPSAPLTVQVRRAGVELGDASVRGIEYDDLSYDATAALVFVQALGIEPWDGLQGDLDKEAAAPAIAETERQLRAAAAAQAVEVYTQAVAEAEEEAAAAEAHAQEHPDDEHLQDIANIARSSVWLVKDQADRAAATADALANG